MKGNADSMFMAGQEEQGDVDPGVGNVSTGAGEPREYDPVPTPARTSDCT